MRAPFSSGANDQHCVPTLGIADFELRIELWAYAG